MKLIIAGSRDFNDIKLASRALSVFMRNHDVSEIVSGGARGADQIGEALADLAGIPVKRFIPDWGGTSRGTKQMIDCATKKGLIVEVIYYED